MRFIPRIRITTRRWMVVVAIIGLLLEIEILRRRSGDYGRMAAYHALQEKSIQPKVHHHSSELRDLRWKVASCRRTADTYRLKKTQAQRELDAKLAAGLPANQGERRWPWYWKMQVDEAEWKLRRAESRIAYFETGPAYHRRMRAGYEWAACHAWESVEIEPLPWENYGTSESFQPDPPPP